MYLKKAIKGQNKGNKPLATFHHGSLIVKEYSNISLLDHFLPLLLIEDCTFHKVRFP